MTASPGEDAGVPAPALLVRDFLNTVEWQEDTDSWTTPDDLELWFAERVGGTASGSTEGDLVLAKRLREGLRSVALQHAGHEPLPTSAADLDAALASVPLRMRVDDRGELRLDGAGVSPLAHILVAVDVLRAEGSWSRLKACARESCRWAYWDASRNRSGRWCSMAWCGNYVKMRTRNGDPLGPEELLPRRGDARSATLLDVAGRAGVSIATVSNVIRGVRTVSPPVRARVEAAIAELEYRPNESARALRSLR